MLRVPESLLTAPRGSVPRGRLPRPSGRGRWLAAVSCAASGDIADHPASNHAATKVHEASLLTIGPTFHSALETAFTTIPPNVEVYWWRLHHPNGSDANVKDVIGDGFSFDRLSIFE